MGTGGGGSGGGCNGGGGGDGGGIGGGGDGGGERTAHEPSSIVALESKLKARGARQPGTSYRQHAGSHAALASAAKLRAVESVQPGMRYRHVPSLRVAAES